MEKIINIHIEKLPEGFYLATSDSIQGLIAQGRTVTETLEIARDVAKKLLEAQSDETVNQKLKQFGFGFHPQAAGSHEIWFNPNTKRYTTIPNHPGDMPEGALRAILKQADIGVDEFLRA